METDFVSLIELALKVDVCISLRQLVFGGDQVRVEAVGTECSLELIVSSVGSGFRIDFESLDGRLVGRVCDGLVRTNLAEIFQIALLICLLKCFPSILG